MTASSKIDSDFVPRWMFEESKKEIRHLWRTVSDMQAQLENNGVYRKPPQMRIDPEEEEARAWACCDYKIAMDILPRPVKNRAEVAARIITELHSLKGSTGEYISKGQEQPKIKTAGAQLREGLSESDLQDRQRAIRASAAFSNAVA